MIIPVDNAFAITVMSTGSWMMALFYVTTADGLIFILVSPHLGLAFSLVLANYNNLHS